MARSIVEAAEQVFAERGLDARLEDIASRAGVAVGTLYNHFADRQALVEALIESHHVNLTERLELVVERTRDESFRKRLEAILEEIVVAALPKLRLRMLLLQSTPHRVMRQAEMRQKLLAVLGPVLEKARLDGELMPDPHGLQMLMLRGLILAVLTATQEAPPLLTPEASPKIIASAFLDGMGGHGRHESKEQSQ
ncbi:MAG TPA: helix-turn-helix domain-containing protein [Polyangiaceae bacterium]